MALKYFRKSILLTVLLIALVILFEGCSKKTEMPSQYRIDNENFKKSILLLNEARDLSNPSGNENQYSFELSKEIEEKIFSNTRKGIMLGKQVGDSYLIYLHPELKNMFRNKLIKGTEIYYNGLLDNNSGKISEGAPGHRSRFKATSL